jgi:4-diphosphocytidyl-2-C-methyl-D-erythritol kinase
VPAARAERAPAKVNLTLRVLGKRADGYHELESLVAFAGVGDTLTFTPGRALALTVRGATAAASGDVPDNLVLKAARALAERVSGLKPGRFLLTKSLPVAAGVGGGSADAAAALRLLARANRIAAGDARLLEAARATGADVPVCLDSRPRIMRGIGEILSPPLDLPALPAVLVNPGVAVPTKDVFRALRLDSEPRDTNNSSRSLEGLASRGRADLAAVLADTGNDLEAPAIAIQPVIADVLRRLRRLDGCELARMSGSGATCFGLFDTRRAAMAAARALREQKPRWWIRPTVLG